MSGIPAGTLSIEIVAEIARLQQDMAKVKSVVGDMSSDVARKTKAVNDNLSLASGGMTKLEPSARQAAFGMRNLAFQAQDLGVQLTQAAGSSEPLKMALMAFVMQGPQIRDAMNQTGQSALGLAAGFARAHPVLTALTAAAGVAAGGFKLFSAEIDKSGELDRFTASLGLTKEELEKLGPVNVTITDAFVGLWRTIDEGLGLSKVFTAIKDWSVDAFTTALGYGKTAAAGIYAAFVGTYNGIKAVWPMLPRLIGEAAIGAANLAIAAAEKLINQAIDAINLLAVATNPLLAAAKMAGVNVGLSKVTLGRIENVYAGAGREAAGAFQSAYEKAFNDANSGMSKFGERWAKNTIQAAKDRIGQDAQELIDDRSAKKAGEKAGKKAGEEFGKNLLLELMATNDRMRKLLEDTLGTKLVQQAQAEWDKFTDKLNRAGEELPDAFEEALRASGAWNEELRRTVDLLDQIGGAGEGLGDLAAALVGLTSGDWSGTRGPLGHLMQTIGGITWRDAPDANGPGQIRILRDEIVKGLDHVFGGSGSFAKTMSSVLQGAGTGAAIGQIMGGSQASQFGAIAGGALGQVAGQEIGKAVGGTLGKFAGPVGSILGSVAGSLLGGIFKESKSKANVITNGDLTGTFGHTGGDYTRGADALSKAVLDNLERLADALGATATGAYQVSIGMRDGNYVYNPTGSGTKASMGAINVGKDADAAVRGAIQDAISDGVFEGLSAGVERLLRGEGDLDTQLQKALSFQGVFDELERMKDPQGFELKGLGKEFDRLREVFAEAGASTEEYAQLEELYQRKRKEILESGLADAGSAAEIESQRRQMEIQLMELTGDKAGALAAARAMELEQIDPTLRALASEIYARQDALEVRRLEIELMRAQGNEAGAVAAQRELELAALAPLQAALTQQIWAAQDAAAANAALADAQQQAANAAAAAASRMASLQERLLRAQGDEAGLLAFQRAQELGAALSDAEKAMLQQIYAAEDAARVAAEAAARNEEQRRQEAEAARAADELARQRSALELELLRAQGKEEEAMRREREAQLAAMDASLRGLQQQVWAEQELAKVREAAAQKVDDARSALTTAWERENRALQDTIDTFGDLRRELVGFRASLFQSAGFEDFAAQQARYSRTLALARTGQEAALRDLPGVAGSLRDALRDRATSRVDYQLELARMARDIDQAIGATDAVVDFNQLQLDALDRSVEGLIDIKDEVVSVREAIAELRAALQEQTNVTKEVGKKQIANGNELNRILNDAADGVQPLTFQTAET